MTRQIIKLWSKEKPFATPEDATLKEHLNTVMEDGGIDRITDITEPELHYCPATGPEPHPAMLVCPGGGYSFLAWSHEGTDIASLLNINGITAFILKYRCPNRRQAAFADAARAMRLIRKNAESFSIIPDKVGAIGFSAGGHLSAMLSASAEERPYAPIDEADSIPFRPNCTVLVYPAYIADDKLNISPEFKITSSIAPTLLFQTEDDHINVCNSLGWYYALKKANVPAEMHLFAEGGHGYGIMRKGFPVIEWGNMAASWLRRVFNIL